MVFKIFWLFRAIIYKLFFKRIGKLTYIGKPTFLSGVNKVEIGERVRIFPGIRMEVLNNYSSIKIKDNVSIGQNLHIVSGADLIISKDSTISSNVFITNIEHSYKEIDRHIMDQSIIVKDTIIGENCFIGCGARIQAGTKLGKQCIVGTNAVVKGEYPDYSVIVGAPARIIKRYNLESKKWERTNKKGEFIDG